MESPSQTPAATPATAPSAPVPSPAPDGVVPAPAEPPMAQPPADQSEPAQSVPPAVQSAGNVPVAEPPQDPLQVVVEAQRVAKAQTGSGSAGGPFLIISTAVVFFVTLCAVAYIAYSKS